MRSKTSFFNKTVFAHDLKRFWPLTAGYTLIWFLILPLMLLTEYGYGYYTPETWQVQRNALDVTASGGWISALCVGVLFAMAAFSYLTNPRATNGLHALSARRETLFVTHWLAGLVSQIAPQAFVVLLTAAILGAHGAFDARVTGLMLLTMLLPTLFFYSFGVLCMTFTGQILAAPVFYGVLNVLVVGVETLVRLLAGNFLYGWASELSPVLTPFSPVVEMALSVRANLDYAEPLPNDPFGPAVRSIGVEGLGWLWLYAAVGLALAVLALLVYRRRHSEATGNIVAIGWARPVFKYGLAFCAALALGQLVYYVFFGQYRSNGDYSLPGTLLCMAAAGLIGYFAAEMLLKKSFRVWKSGWKGAVAVMAALVALGLALSFDLTGYEKYVPDADQVESVSVEFNSYMGNHSCYITTDDPDIIRLAADAHRAVVGDKARQLKNTRYEADDSGDAVSGYFGVVYHLKNGDLVRRRYGFVTLYENEANRPGSPTAALTALYNDPDAAVLRALGRWGYNADRDPRAMKDLRFTGGYYNRSKWVGGEYAGEIERDLTPAEAQRLYDAALRDAAAGRLEESLFDEYRQQVIVELYATYLDTRSYAGSTEPMQDADGRVQVTFDLVVTPRMTETVAALRAMGIEITFE